MYKRQDEDDDALGGKKKKARAPSKINIRRIMDKVNDRRRANGFDPVYDLNESSLEEVEVKMVGKEHSIDESMLDETAIFDFKDLEREEDRIKGMSGEVRTLQFQFVLLVSAGGKEWEIPDTQTFHDLINQVECTLLQAKSPLSKVLRWINLWGSVGLMGLSAKS